MNQVDQILQKEMDRKEFFRVSGAAMLAVVGVSGLVKSLSSIFTSSSAKQELSGYGSSPYGR